MLNQIVLVGRLVNNPEVRETEEGKKVSTITLSIPRKLKTEDRVYETDFIDLTLWTGIAINTAEYCKKGDLIGIKGRIQSKEGNIEIVAEKVTFLSSSRKDEE